MPVSPFAGKIRSTSLPTGFCFSDDTAGMGDLSPVVGVRMNVAAAASDRLQFPHMGDVAA